MSASEFCYWPISKLIAAYRGHRLSPVEVCNAMLDRIERLNPTINAFIELTGERARAAARVAEREMSRQVFRGPLHGVPVAVKDLFFMRGAHARAGSLLYRHFHPDFDATAVERLEAAGAVILGRAHMHELAFGVTNVNPHYGACRNPWNIERVPGGSSGGSAAAVAAGLSFAALGTDTGGSIRIPASFCGVTGFKPTYGRISRHGVMPLSWQLDHVGTFARSAEDAAVAAQAIAGGDPMDASCLTAPTPPWAERIDAPPRDWKLGLVGPPFVSRIQPDVSNAIVNAAHAFQEAGLIVEPTQIPDAIEAGELAHLQVLVEGAAVLDQGYREDPTQFGDDVRALIEQGHFVSAVDYLHALRYRRVFQRQLDRMFDTYRALLLPATPMAAPRITDESVIINGTEEGVGPAATRLVRQFNFAGVPVLTVPCGFTSEGLPIGMQIVTRAGDELSGLQLGRFYQGLTGSHQAFPAL
jgi:aspartyl-tRNA(Asn)/glutamyl-tRNA(Gln) amidotransferase subunit A